jgi:hypothetical protein
MRVVSSDLVENSGRNREFSEGRSALRAGVLLLRLWGASSPGTASRLGRNLVRAWTPKLSFEREWSRSIWFGIEREIADRVVAGPVRLSRYSVSVQRARFCRVPQHIECGGFSYAQLTKKKGRSRPVTYSI